MEKRLFNLVLYGVLLVVLSYLVFGAHTATVLIGPTEVYETNKETFYLFVGNNPGSTHSVTNVTITHPGYNVIEILNLPNWQYDGDINWYNGLISAFGSQTFVFNATAQLVNANTTYSWDVTTIDTNGETQTNTLSVIVLNDSIPPSIVSISPEDFSFVRNETINFIINVQELETSIPGDFSLSFRDSNPMAESGAVKDSVVMTNNGGNMFTGSLNANDPSKIDLSSGSMFLDYRISDLSDAAGNQYTETGFPHHIYIDIEYPLVVLNQPVNNYLTNQYLHNITFNMSDNSFETNGWGLFNPEVNCTSNVQGVEYGPNSYNNNVSDGYFTANLTGLPDDYYNFFVYCLDKAGYVSISEFRTLRLDTTGPEIILNSPANGSVITNGTLITLSVIDTIAGIDYVWYNNGTTDFTVFDGSGESAAGVIINTFDWEEGENNIIFYANDTLNNLATPLPLTFFVDKNSPTVSLVSPVNSTLVGGNVDFIFNATDDYDNVLDCQLLVDGISILALPAVSGQDTTFSYNGFVADGLHSWNVLCYDDYNPPIISETRNVDVDMTPPSPPSLLPFDALNGTNDDDGFVDISFNVTDENGLSGCVLSLSGVNQTNSTADFSINLIMSNDPYTINIGCNDTVDNWYYFPNLILYYDKIAPDILDVNSTGITTSNAIISWNTNENADRNVTYWTDPNSTISSSVYIFEMNHSMPLSGLSASTTYIYSVGSSDMWGNMNTTSGFSFTTEAAPASPGSPGGGGGSSSGGGKCNENWTCTEWSGCTNNNGAGIQTRVCVDLNDCDKEEYKPAESQSCLLSFEDEEIDEYGVEEESVEEPVLTTGFSIADVLESTPFKAVVALLIVGLIIAGFLRLMKERPPKRINVEDHLKDEDTPFSIE